MPLQFDVFFIRISIYYDSKIMFLMQVGLTHAPVETKPNACFAGFRTSTQPTRNPKSFS